MMSPSLSMPEGQFLQHVAQRAPQLMWFLGAGVSRTAGMPTASDIIWDLKRKYYCLQENQDVQHYKINSKAIQAKLQSYLDAKGFPSASSPEEYSFYFDLVFGGDQKAQREYIAAQVAPNRISLNVGHRVLAALLSNGNAKIIFTTNFDDVIETAYSFVSGRNLTAFHLEGSYAALDALNAEQYPIYAKLHGDFRYRSIKNLADDLKTNDAEIQKCFLTAASRYGLIIAGYSGRDQNIVELFNEALKQTNAFPHGFFWTTTSRSDIPRSVEELVATAQQRGITAQIVETGPFDVMASRLWRQMPQRSADLDLKIRTAKVQAPSVPLPRPGKKYPILRTNGLPVTASPARCGKIVLATPISPADFRQRRHDQRPSAVTVLTENLLFWGQTEVVRKLIEGYEIKSVVAEEFEDVISTVRDSTLLKFFFEQAIVEALCDSKPLFVRRNKAKSYFIVPAQTAVKEPLFQPLKKAVGFGGAPGSLTGQIPGLPTATWAECVSIKLEEKNGGLWLLLRPDIWISPLALREEAISFLRKRRLRRYNPQAYRILDAWIKILLGTVGSAAEVEVTYMPNSEFPARFKINTRTAFSGGAHG